MTRSILARGVLALLPLLVGCRSIPDLTPFAEATHGLAGTLTSTSGVLVSDLRRAGQANDADALEAALQPALEAATAITNYSDALANLSAAGKDGRANGEKLGGALDELAGVLAVQLPIQFGPVAGLINQWVAEARAAASFKKAVEAADPAIATLAPLMQQVLAQLHDLLENNERSVVDWISDENKGVLILDDVNSGKIIQLHRDLTIEISRLASQAASNPLTEQELSQLLALRAELEVNTPQYDVAAKLVQDERRKHASLRLAVEKASLGFGIWAKTHQGLVDAIGEERAPDVRRLQQSALEIQALVQAARK